MNTGDAAAEAVRRVEERGVGVGDLGCQRQGMPRPCVPFDLLQQLYRAAGPDCPVSQQAAYDAQRGFAEPEGSQQVYQEVVVIARVERDLPGAAGFRYGAYDVQRLIAIERGHLDRHYVFDFGEGAPEFVREYATTYRRLQVEAEQRDDCGYRAGVIEELRYGGCRHRAQAEESGVIAHAGCLLGFFHCLRRLAYNSRDPDRGLVAQFLHGQLHNRRLQAVVADLDLCVLPSDRRAARAGCQVVTRQRPLTSLVQLALRREGQRVRRDYHAFSQSLAPGHLEFAVPGFEVGWLVQCGAAQADPVRHHFDHLLDRYRRVAE